MEMFVMALGILGFTFNYNYMDLFEQDGYDKQMYGDFKIDRQKDRWINR